MTRLERARLAMEEADKRAQDRKKDYEDLLKQEEKKTDQEIIAVVRAWAKKLPEKMEWSSVPDRLKMVLGLSEKKKECMSNDDE